MKKRHVTSFYEKNQIPSLNTTKHLFFDKFHAKEVSGPSTTSQVNDYNVLFPRNEEGKVYVGICVY